MQVQTCYQYQIQQLFRTEGVLVILYLFIAFSQFLFLGPYVVRTVVRSPLVFIWLNFEPV